MLVDPSTETAPPAASAVLFEKVLPVTPTCAEPVPTKSAPPLSPELLFETVLPSIVTTVEASTAMPPPLPLAWQSSSTLFDTTIELDDDTSRQPPAPPWSLVSVTRPSTIVKPLSTLSGAFSNSTMRWGLLTESPCSVVVAAPSVDTSEMDLPTIATCWK